MNCFEIKELLSHYYDCELSPDDRERVGAHLEHCAECSMELARFGELSAMMDQMPAPAPLAIGWRDFEKRLVESASLEAAPGVERSRRSTRSNWRSFQRLRPVTAAAALLLVAVGWFAVEFWFGHGSHNLLAADIRQYVNEFERDPQAAQQQLFAKYDGETVGLEEAMRRVSYRPVAARGLPAAYTVDSMHILNMPCCNCLQTVCQRSDGSKFVIFEYAEEHPAFAAVRVGGMEACRGENCCLVQINDQFAMSWKMGEHHISIVGVRDQIEMNQIAAWFN